jgi:hypothetical protein
MTLIPPKQIGRTLSGEEAMELILQLAESQGKTEPSEGRGVAVLPSDSRAERRSGRLVFDSK